MATTPKKSIAVIGAGFVADLYMRSIELYPEAEVVGVYDVAPERAARFERFWSVPAAGSLEELLTRLPEDGLVLNLTNPGAHYEVTKRCLEAGRSVYSEKPLAMDVENARELVALAEAKGLGLAAAPCSHLSEAAQTLGAAIREKVAGEVKLVYAELDDGYIPQAPYEHWLSESGAPWPAEDEFRVGCTVEHAGYYLTWLISIFGPVRTVVAASATLAEKSIPMEESAPDTSIGVLFFESGAVARLTCSILAPHDHQIRLVGDGGVIELNECWDNRAPVRFRKRMRIRRRLLESPLPRRLRLPGPTHPAVKRRGAAAMNFFLGPAELMEARAEGRESRTDAALALHVTEVTLALQNAGETTGAQAMTTTCPPIAPLPWAERLK